MTEAPAAPRVVFWDVDTQFDFMTPPERGGRLYVRDLADASDPGAEQILPRLAALSRFARDHGILRVATGDWHTLEHREIDAVSPDFRTTYPPHCMAGERGSEKLPETALRDPVVVPLRADADDARGAARQALAGGRDLFVHKEEFCCFAGNPATEALVRALDAGAYVVYGVALDVCVRFAVEGLLERGERVFLVDDATWGLGLEARDALIRRWAARGLRRVATEQVVAARSADDLVRRLAAAADR